MCRCRACRKYVLCVALAGVVLTSAASTLAQTSHRVARHLGRLVLELESPNLDAPLISMAPCTLRVQATYSGSGELTFSLVTGPGGMTIDAAAGLLTWTPPIEMEGSSANVEVAATDGQFTAHTSFSVPVARTEAVPASLAGTTLTVSGNGTLHNLSFTFPCEVSLPLAGVSVARVPTGEAPAVSASIVRISDFFRVTPVAALHGDIVVTMPTTALPEGVPADTVRLYVWGRAHVNAMVGAAIDKEFWLSSSFGLDVVPSGAVTVLVDRLGGLSFIGYDKGLAEVQAQRPGARSNAARASAGPWPPAAAQAHARRFSNGTVSNHIIEISPVAAGSEPLQVILVVGFETNHWVPAVDVWSLYSWIDSSRERFTAMGLRSDPVLRVEIHDIDDPSVLGFVTSQNGENYRTLHLSRHEWGVDLMQCTTAHEYFHHAQARTTEEDKTNLMSTGHSSDWLIESTATWFEDEVFDENDCYRQLNHNPIPPVLNLGLARGYDAKLPETWPYDRFAFWKLLSTHCEGFSIPQLLNISSGSDKPAVSNLKERLESEAWNCIYDPRHGASNRTLAAALAVYSFDTTLFQDIALLDDDENTEGISFSLPAHRVWRPDLCTRNPDCEVGYTHVAAPVASAVPFLVNQAINLDGRLVYVQVTPGSRDNPLWVMASAYHVADLHMHGGQENPIHDTITYFFPDATEAPGTAVAVVNSDPHEGTEFSILGVKVTPRINVVSATCTYLGPGGQEHFGYYKISAAGGATGVPGASWLYVGGDWVVPKLSQTLECPVWSGNTDHSTYCESAPADSDTTYWSLDATFLASCPCFDYPRLNLYTHQMTDASATRVLSFTCNPPSQ